MLSGATGAGAGSLCPVSRISVVGVPSSAASYAAGQDLAPAALRSAGLLEQLTAAGLTGPRLEPDPAFPERPPYGFRLGFVGQVGHFANQHFNVEVLDIQRHGRKLPLLHH